MLKISKASLLLILSSALQVSCGVGAYSTSSGPQPEVRSPITAPVVTPTAVAVPTVAKPTSADYLKECLQNENISQRTPKPVFAATDLLVCGILADLNLSTLNGCWVCAADNVLNIHDSGSIYGQSIGMNSIRNHASIYGTRTDLGSACNVDATRPPRLVHPDGSLDGHLSLSKSFDGSVCNAGSSFYNKPYCDQLEAYCIEQY